MHRLLRRPLLPLDMIVALVERLATIGCFVDEAEGWSTT